MQQGYGYNDISIIPAPISFIRHRKGISVYDHNKKLPIFTAPMSTVVNENNFDYFNQNKIYSIIPRNISFDIRLDHMRKGQWVAMSLEEFESLVDIEEDIAGSKICIDVANGHMDCLYSTCADVYEHFQEDYTIMVGNIANPDTIYNIRSNYKKTNIRFIRLSIGSGSGCITSSNTGIHYPIATLIQECKKVRDRVFPELELVADGGIKNYSDVIKALALGADYVMIGGLFASAYESAAPITNKETLTEYPIILDASEEIKKELILRNKFIKNFYGMASKQGKVDLGTKGTAEGIEKTFEVTYTLKQWVENMEDYLRSAMSYCDTFSLEEFIGTPSLIINSTSEQLSINK